MSVAVVLLQTTNPRAIHTMRTLPPNRSTEYCRCHDQGILVWSAPFSGQFLFEPCFYFGQCLFWPIFTWATFHVGQSSGPRGGWRVFQKKVWAVWVVGPGWAQLRVGSRQGGGGAAWEPQISRFCCLFPPNMSMMFSSLGVFSWNCGGVSRPRSTQNPRGFTRALLRSFSEEPLGLAQDGAREAQTRILGGSWASRRHRNSARSKTLRHFGREQEKQARHFGFPPWTALTLDEQLEPPTIYRRNPASSGPSCGTGQRGNQPKLKLAKVELGPT